MNLEDEFRYLVSGYYGIESMDEYEFKDQVLKDVENFIRNFVVNNPASNFDYAAIASQAKSDKNLIIKLQDSLLTLTRIPAPKELTQLIEQKIIKLREDNTRMW